MGKGNGSTRSSSAGSPRGVGNQNNGRSFSGWQLGEDRYGSPELRAKGNDAADIYYALSSSVEQAVESKVGNIRSGGGMSGPMDDREYTIIFRSNATYKQIENYIKEMSVGAKLFAERDKAYKIGTSEEYDKASEAYAKWFNKTYRR